MSLSNSFISTVTGIQLIADTPNISGNTLPRQIAILGEANAANQSGLSLLPKQITSAYDAGVTYGFGSPIYLAARILLPVNGGGTGVPVWVYPQEEAGSATVRTQTITVSGTATANVTHFVTVGGRNAIDGQTYSFNVVVGDTAATVASKLNDAINNVTSSPISSTRSSAVVTASTKWKGATAQGVEISVDISNNAGGMAYAIAETVEGVGTPSVADALTSFGTNWITDVISCYGTNSTVMDELQTFNGVPSQTTPTGRYAETISRPFIAYVGSVADDPAAAISGRTSQVTIGVCPTPLSQGLPLEGAANWCMVYATTANDNPHADVIDRELPDMPLPAAGDVPAMQSYTERNRVVKLGCSTVEIVAGVYRIRDFVTTYAPSGDNNPTYRWVRNLAGIDFNVIYLYNLMVTQYLIGKTIVGDDDITGASITGIIRKSTWKGMVFSLADTLVSFALITNARYMQDSVTVNLATGNPDRLNTTFAYKRTSTARISDTVAKAGFSFQ